MYYSKINTNDISNGPGVRVSLFVSGCNRHCDGCFNKETWDFSNGDIYTDETLGKILSELARNEIIGLSILGGEPLEDENLERVSRLCYVAKTAFPKKDIWLYTGYKLEDIINTSKDIILSFIDILVDGPFINKEKDISLKFKGSRNQRIIDINYYNETGIILEVEA